MPRNKYQTVTVLPPASQFGRGESVIYQGEVLTSDGTNWTSQTGPLSYEAGELPDPATLGVGADAIVGGMPVQVKDGKFLGEYTVGSGIPFVVPSSGNITSTSGGVTVTSAFGYIIGPSYTFFPQSALFAKSPSGWYYTVWSSTTVGKVYADVYYIDVPKIPTNPTSLTTVTGAYTQAKDYFAVGPSYIIPAGFMGKNGSIIWNRQVGCKSSATKKTFGGFFGQETFQGGDITTNIASGQSGSVVNRGTSIRQCAANAAFGDSGLASSLSRLIVDTGKNQIISMRVKIVDATDFAIIEAHSITIKRGE